MTRNANRGPRRTGPPETSSRSAATCATCVRRFPADAQADKYPRALFREGFEARLPSLQEDQWSNQSTGPTANQGATMSRTQNARFRPTLTVLESRDCPARWLLGGTPGDWDNPSNWDTK